jgi:hypothetical protein
MRRRGLRHVVHVPRAGTSGAPEPSSRDSRHSPPGECTRLAASGPHDRNWSSPASVDRSTKPGELHGAPARVAARRSSFLVQRSPAAPDLQPVPARASVSSGTHDCSRCRPGVARSLGRQGRRGRAGRARVMGPSTSRDMAGVTPDRRGRTHGPSCAVAGRCLRPLNAPNR